MVTLDEAIDKGHKRYFKNAFWKGLYAAAPDDAKKYYDLIFSQLDGGNDAENDIEFRKQMDKTYKEMGDSGWKYLMDHTTSQMEKHHLAERKKQYKRSVV